MKKEGKGREEKRRQGKNKLEKYETGMINWNTNREVKQTSVINLRALEGQPQCFHIIHNLRLVVRMTSSMNPKSKNGNPLPSVKFP